MNDHSSIPTPATPVADHDVLPPWQSAILEGLLALARRRLLIVAVSALGIGLGIAAHTRTPRFYRASAVMVLLPREKPVLDLAVRSSSIEIGDDAAHRDDAANLSLPPNPDLYTTLLRSRPVTERIAMHFSDRLSPDGHPGAADDLILGVRSMIDVASTDEGILTVTVTSSSPSLASDIANAVVAECSTASKAIERQLLEQQAGYLAEALARASARLESAHAELCDFGRRYGIVDPQLEADKSMRSWREIEAQLMSLRSDLARRSIHRTDMDSTIVGLRRTIASLEEERSRVLGAFAGTTTDGDYARIVAEWNRLNQDAQFNRDLVATISMRHDVFLIRAAQPAGSMAVLHPATPPQLHAGPSRRRLYASGGALGVMVGCALALALDQVQRVRAEPRLAPLMNELIRELRPVMPSKIRIRRA